MSLEEVKRLSRDEMYLWAAYFAVLKEETES